MTKGEAFWSQFGSKDWKPSCSKIIRTCKKILLQWITLTNSKILWKFETNAIICSKCICWINFELFEVISPNNVPTGSKKNKLKIVFVFHSFKIKKNEFKIKNFVFFYHSTSLKIVNMLFVKILQQLFFRILQPVTWLFYYSKTYSCNNFHL